MSLVDPASDTFAEPAPPGPAPHFLTTAVLRGPGRTLWLTALAMALGFVLCTLLAIMRLPAAPRLCPAWLAAGAR
ncbi:hypothetical protein SNA_12440 [Streptomyces natalensis ATCC 27448]|uniref:Uncharacterized protein n=1 Tax=Streptomyces natalensis ATCC 27448 TaxID=1240678 RepID=A0A0D7CQW5_9ACTN|nr:hypothetical protein SNA_12440 [Streptomyces natalensis ATCC 27448]